MNTSEIKNRVLIGARLAIVRLVEKRRQENAYLVVSVKGKVVKVLAKDIRV